MIRRDPKSKKRKKKRRKSKPTKLTLRTKKSTESFRTQRSIWTVSKIKANGSPWMLLTFSRIRNLQDKLSLKIKTTPRASQTPIMTSRSKETSIRTTRNPLRIWTMMKLQKLSQLVRNCSERRTERKSSIKPIIDTITRMILKTFLFGSLRMRKSTLERFPLLLKRMPRGKRTNFGPSKIECPKKSWRPKWDKRKSSFISSKRLRIKSLVYLTRKEAIPGLRLVRLMSFIRGPSRPRGPIRKRSLLGPRLQLLLLIGPLEGSSKWSIKDSRKTSRECRGRPRGSKSPRELIRRENNKTLNLLIF